MVISAVIRRRIICRKANKAIIEKNALISLFLFILNLILFFEVMAAHRVTEDFPGDFSKQHKINSGKEIFKDC